MMNHVGSPKAGGLVLVSLASALVVASTGCAAAPLNGDSLTGAQASGTSAITVEAFIPTSAGTVTFTQSDGNSADPSVANTFPATTDEATDQQGITWYGFSSSLTLSANPELWTVLSGVPAGGQNVMSTYLTVTATSSALGSNYELYTFPGGSSDAATNACFQSAYEAGGGFNVISECGGKQAPIKLILNCGGPGQPCCAPSCANGAAFESTPCTNGADGTVFACTANNPYTAGTCQPTGQKCGQPGQAPCGVPNCPGAGQGTVRQCPFGQPQC